MELHSETVRILWFKNFILRSRNEWRWADSESDSHSRNYTTCLRNKKRLITSNRMKKLSSGRIQFKFKIRDTKSWCSIIFRHKLISLLLYSSRLTASRENEDLKQPPFFLLYSNYTLPLSKIPSPQSKNISLTPDQPRRTINPQNTFTYHCIIFLPTLEKL